MMSGVGVKETFIQTLDKVVEKTYTLKNRTIAAVLCSRVKLNLEKIKGQ